jgi:hypothetical protein
MLMLLSQHCSNCVVLDRVTGPVTRVANKLTS